MSTKKSRRAYFPAGYGALQLSSFSAGYTFLAQWSLFPCGYNLPRQICFCMSIPYGLYIFSGCAAA